MIDRLSEWSERLLWLRTPLSLITVAAFLLLGWEVLSDPLSDEPDLLMLPALLVLIWCICGLTVINLFRTVPPPPPAEARFAERFGTQLKRGCFHVFAWAFAGLGIAILVTTWRLVNIWLAQ